MNKSYIEIQRETFSSFNDFLFKVSRGEISHLLPKSGDKELKFKKEKTIDDKLQESILGDPEKELNELRKYAPDYKENPFDEIIEIENMTSEKEADISFNKRINLI